MPYSSSATTVIQASREKVWQGLTDPVLVKQYFFGTDLDTTWQVGTPVTFRGEHEGKKYEDHGTVLGFEPLRSLSYDYWSSFSGKEDKPELRQILRYELTEEASGIRVTIAQSNVDTQERADHSAKNWQSVLGGLKQLLEQRH